MTDVFEKSKTRGAARLVLLALADTASDEGQCFPAIKTLSKKAGVREQTAREYLHVFAIIGLINVTARGGEGRQTSNLYTIIRSQIGKDEITGEMLAEVRPPSANKKALSPGVTPPTRGYRPPSPQVIPPPSHLGRYEPSVNPKKERVTGDKLIRQRDLLFDAIVKLCQVDPATAASSIGNVKRALLSSEPPYTAAEVESFGKWWWGWDKRTTAPSLWNLKEKIGVVRTTNPNATKTPAVNNGWDIRPKSQKDAEKAKGNS